MAVVWHPLLETTRRRERNVLASRAPRPRQAPRLVLMLGSVSRVRALSSGGLISEQTTRASIKEKKEPYLWRNNSRSADCRPRGLVHDTGWAERRTCGGLHTS